MAVDTKDKKIRCVRCPKCSKILIEPTDVPVYQCGGCSAVLQAKHYNAAGENCCSGSVKIKQSDNPLASVSSDKGANSKGKEITGPSNVHDSEAAHIADQSESVDLDLSSFSAGYNCHERGESSGSGGDGMEEEVSSNDQFESRSDAEYTSKSPPYGSIQTGTEHCLKVEADKPVKCSQQVSNDLMLSEKSEEYQKLSDGCILARSDHCLKEVAEKPVKSFQQGSENMTLNEKSAHPKSSEYKESGIKEGSDAGQSSLSGNTLNATIPQQNENIPTETEYCLIEEVEKSQKQSLPVSSEILEESSESVSRAVATENDLVDESHGSVHGECLSSPNRSTQTYDYSVYSCNRTSDCVGDKYMRLSNGSFRNHSFSGSVDIKGMRGVSKSDEIPGPSLKISNQGKIFDSSMDGLFSKRTRPRERGTSLDSSGFHSMENRIGYKGYSRPLTRGSTFQGDSLNCNSGHPSAIFKHLEQDRLELLSIVAELRDQLGDIQCKRGGEKRTHIGRIPSLQPVILDPKSGQQFLNRKSIPRPPGTHYESKSSLSQQHLLPLDGSCCSCLDCRLEGRLPFLPISCDNGLCRACARNMSSHQPHLHIGCNVHPCCQKAQTHDLKVEKLQHENRQSSKRYCRPLSGGAPFVICYKCFEVLLLPADFVISRERSKKLQCGACFKTLLFSFPTGARITQNPIQGFHSAKEVDSSAVASTGQETSVSSSDGCPLGDPPSFSEEHELSFSSSCSTMDESVLNVSKNSFKERNVKRLTSKLHRLMGYSSATEVLYQPNYSGEEYQKVQC